MIQPKVLERWRVHFRAWIATVAARCAGRLYGREDIEQEGYIQLWRCLVKASHLPPSEFIGFFKVCFCNRVANIMKRAEYRYKAPLSIDYEVDLRMEASPNDHDEFWYRQRIREVVRLTQDPAVRKWIRKATMRSGKLTGLRPEIVREVENLVAACSI